MRDLIVVIFLTGVSCDAGLDAREDIFRDFIVDVADIHCRKNSYIHTAMIMTNILGKSVDVNFTKESYFEGEKPKMIVTLQKMLQTLLELAVIVGRMQGKIFSGILLFMWQTSIVGRIHTSTQP